MRLAGLVLWTVFCFADSPFTGHWVGAIKLPSGELEINVDLTTAEDGELVGDISIPVQNIEDLGLVQLNADEHRIAFKLPDIPGDPSFEGTLSDEGTRIEGSFTQSGNNLSFELTRGDDVHAMAMAALEGFDEQVEQAVADFGVPGLGIAIVAGGEVAYAKGFGYRDLENELPMKPDTLFAIGSTTKAMTATVLGMFVDEGKLQWDQPLREYLPTFRLSDPMISARITPRDLVTHRSGLPRHDLLWYNYNQGTRAELITRFQHLELTADLREKFQYNNLMFMTAGYLAGRLNGTTWEEAVYQRLFEPLGMTRSNFSVNDSKADDDHALPYREEDGVQQLIPFRSIDLIGPAGSVNSSVNEMAKWLLFNLGEGKVGDTRLISQATLDDIHSPHMTTGRSSTRDDIVPIGYGMGWSIDMYRGHLRISHGGGIDGFITSVMFFPNDDIGMVSFVNTGSGLGSLVNQHAADILLGLASVDWTGDALARRKQADEGRDEAESKRDAERVKKTKPSHGIDDYTGSYHDPGYGTMTIKTSDEKNGLVMIFNGIEAPLEHWHYDVWNGAESQGDPTFEGTKFLFRGNFDGEIAAVETPFELLGKPIVFEKQPDPRLSNPSHLARYVGTYVSRTGQSEEIALSGHRLTLSIPGQPLYTLVPLVSGRFGIDGLQGFSVGFGEDDAGNVNKIVYYQPNGVFESKRQDAAGD